jgi:hypothetical protein
MDKALQTMINNMPAKTGKSLDDWKELLSTKSFAKHSEAVKFLKTEYGVSHGFANTIVRLSKDEDNTPDDLLANQYRGKEGLKPVYDRLIALVKTFGADVSIVPKKGSVSLVRKKQFALIKPASKTRVDLGLKLKGKELTERLGDSGPFGTMCTHRVQISNPDAVDKELEVWLLEAYEKAV